MKQVIAFEVPAAPERVAQVMISEAYVLEEGATRDGVVSAEFEPVLASESRVEFKAHYVEYHRTRTGALDRSGTRRGTNHGTFDAASRTIRWDYRTDASDKFRVGGTYRFHPTTVGTRVEHEVTIEVLIPLVGGAIAHIIGHLMKKDLPRQQALLRKYLQEDSARTATD